jgi:ubiquinone/menaquinone biosynthesis C-methylase UbiE
MAKSSGCDVTLIDPDAERIALACARAIEDDLEGDWTADVGDGASLPYEDATFDAIGHSDVLCCLSDKRSVLTECRRVARSDAHMAFSVIAAESGLGDTAYRRALDHGPDLMATEEDYPTMLRTTGWHIVRHDDMTQAFLIATQRQLQSGDGREEKWKCRIAALKDGLLRRDLFVVAPADQ